MPCSLRRLGFSELEQWILSRFPAEIFPTGLFAVALSALCSGSILCITGSEINFFRQAPTTEIFFSVAKWKNVVAKKGQ